VGGGGEAETGPRELTAGPDDAGLRLDAFLAARGAFPSRAAAQRAIEGGEVTVDGVARPKNHRVEADDRVAIAAHETPAPPPPAATFTTVYEDPDLMVVEKPAGLVTHPAPGHHGVTLAELLPAGSSVVHRLDKDTSGLLLVARSDAALEALQAMMKAREVTREYTALVEGHPDAELGTIDAPIGRDRANRTVMSTRTDRARDAITHFKVLERLPRTSLLRVRLETGRTHQIRAHLAAIGHPVVGDPQYGGSASGRRLGLNRQFLHASTLMFRHPFTGELVRCESKPPVELSHAIDTARREPVSGGPDGG
jgi:23S rRNA pseudouridine1911/1915/1917 synthase